MIPVMQSCMLSPGGDCFAACLASILELPLSAIPKPTRHQGTYDVAFYYYITRINRHVLKPMGLYISFQPGMKLNDSEKTYRPPGLHIANVKVRMYNLDGKPTNSTSMHCVVCRGKTVVHDPSPAQTEILDFHSSYLLIPYDPVDIRTMKLVRS